MKTEIRERWTAELRSGNYDQGSNFLATKDGKYCCLGVLCELAVADGVIGKSQHENWDAIVYGPLDETRILPVAVQRWAGLRNSSPAVPKGAVSETDSRAAFTIRQADLGGHDSVNLASLNDAGLPFTDIADLIDANFPETDEDDWDDETEEGE